MIAASKRGIPPPGLTGRLTDRLNQNQSNAPPDKLRFRVRSEGGAQWTLAADEENEEEGGKWVEAIAGAIARCVFAFAGGAFCACRGA